MWQFANLTNIRSPYTRDGQKPILQQQSLLETPLLAAAAAEIVSVYNMHE
jgi:hypothetical protein